jgi:Ca-activated chloride channel family protein
MQFEFSSHLWILLLIPILVMGFLLYQLWQRKAIQRFGNLDLLQQLMPQRSRWKNSIKFGLIMLVLVCLGFAYANPQMGTKKAKVEQKSIDIFIALDVSNSMLAKDISPSRLERAKQFSFKLMNEFKTDKVGLILFAGTAHLQMPLTNDYSAAQTFIKTATSDMVSTQGTAIGEAIVLAEKSFEPNNKQHKALIILSDGENHEGEAINKATTASENGMLIFTVGVGSNKATPIMINEFGRTVYKRDALGEIVKTKLNQAMLIDVAKAAKGTYFKLNNDEKILKALTANIQKIEKRTVEQRIFDEYESYFQWFVIIAFILLGIELFISQQKSTFLKGRKFLNRRISKFDE